jgi:hypothetical protein
MSKFAFSRFQLCQFNSHAAPHYFDQRFGPQYAKGSIISTQGPLSTQTATCISVVEELVENNSPSN